MSEGIWVRRTSLVIVHADKKSFNGLLKVLKVESAFVMQLKRTLIGELALSGSFNEIQLKTFESKFF